MRKKTLIPPIPKEYIYYSTQEKKDKTEQFYNKLQELYLKIESIQEECKKRVNILLEKQFELEDLAQVLNEEEMRLLCHNKYEFALLDRLCRIAQMEEIFGEPSILRNVYSLEDVVDWYQKVLFLIRRFEFCWEEDSELLELIKQREVSYICLSEIICENEIVQKTHTACRLTEYLYKNGLQREAVLFIIRLEQTLPYSERKVMRFAMLLLEMREYQLAYEVLIKHQNPDKDVKALQNELGDILGK